MATRSEEKARFKKGMAAGVFGLCTNAVLFALKTAAGVLSGSITVVADAVNNLSDAGGSAVTFTGFMLASRPADREHPFGHARYEYITTLVLSLLILAVGAVLGYTSLMKIITPEPVSASAFTYAVLGVAIAMKGVQAAFYLSVAKKISSDTLKASALDSLTDILATTARRLYGRRRFAVHYGDGNQVGGRRGQPACRQKAARGTGRQTQGNHTFARRGNRYARP